MLRSPCPDPYAEGNVWQALASRQRHGALGRHSPHTGGAVLGSLVWGIHQQKQPLEGHDGCVNTLRWNSNGTRLASGSDDCTIRIWDDQGAPIERLRTRHCFNIFDAQFKPNDESILVSCAADGGICITPSQCSSSLSPHGPSQCSSSLSPHGSPSRIVWTARSTMALKLSIRPSDPEVVLSSFGDGTVRIFDLRAARPLVSCLPVVIDRGRAIVVAEFAPCGDLIAAGMDDSVRLMDVRAACTANRSVQTVNMLRLKPSEQGTCGVSGICWSTGGRSLLANYMGGDVVLFNTVEATSQLLHRSPRVQQPLANSGTATTAVPSAPQQLEDSGSMLGLENIEAEPCSGANHISRSKSAVQQRFHGRSNQRTFAKEVRFLFQDRYVVSGGDCGHLFVWRTSDAALLHRMRADGSICNCVAPHPTLPLIAASGIDSSVKFFKVGGSERPPLVRNVPLPSRKRSMLSAAAAKGFLPQAANATPCRAWLPSLRQYVARRAAAAFSLLRCPSRRRAAPQDATIEFAGN